MENQAQQTNKEIILTCIKELQDQEPEKGVCFTDIYKKFVNEKSAEPVDHTSHLFILSEELTQLYKQDAFFATPDFNRFSHIKLTAEYLTYSEVIAAKFHGNQVDENGIVVNTKLDLINYKSWISQLLSKDKEFNAEDVSVPPTFFDGTLLKNKIAYTSYSRSGNTFLRKYLEGITGVCTGSDGNVSHHLHYQLQHVGFMGEAVTNDNVWIVKTHYPLCHESLQFNAQKAICCVRNPLDVATSIFNFWGTQTQNLSIKQQNFDQLMPEDWDKVIRNEITCWKDFHDYWIKLAKEKNYPVFFFRYEDLSANPQQVLEEVFCFILGVESIEDTYIQKRITYVLNKANSGVHYKPRSGQVNQVNKFTEEQLKFVKEHLEEQLHFFGYTKAPGNSTSFFEFTESAFEEKTYEFRNFNRDMMKVSKQLTQSGECSDDTYSHPYNDGKTNIRGPERSLKNFNYLPLKCDLKD